MQEEWVRTPSLQPAPCKLDSNEAPEKTQDSPSTSNLSNPNRILRELPQPPSKPHSLSDTSHSTAMPLTRAGTLPWQQRPSSNSSTKSRNRLSSIASEDTTAKSTPEVVGGSSGTSHNIQKSQIMQTLGSRDPSWFKQTQDRRQGSPAFRKNQVEDKSERVSTMSSMRLPGMSKESAAEPAVSFLNEGSIRGSSERDYGHHLSTSTEPGGDDTSTISTETSERLQPPTSNTTSSWGDDTSSVGRALAMSPAQGRISPERTERPTSPTKGLGGFVQSAMLKRSDSVNKRWSAQATPGLSRGNSVASNLSGYGGSRYPLGNVTPLNDSRPSSISREGSPTTFLRPTSSPSNSALAQRSSENVRPGASTNLNDSNVESREDEKTLKSTLGERQSSTPPDVAINPPASPSKRWSPTKSSWLENAINKPDSPKVKLVAPQQPSWMAGLTRAKQQRASIDLGKGSNLKGPISGIVRSPPGKGGFPKGSTAGSNSTPQNVEMNDAVQKGVPSIDINRVDPVEMAFSKELSPTDHLDDVTRVTTNGSATPTVPGCTFSSTESGSYPSRSTVERDPIPPLTSKPKPETPPKNALRSALKPRQSHREKNNQGEPEFKNVFGNLKRAQTKNYVAPNELKDNIMRGKAGLAQSGGPKKFERNDEFKESIIQKKQAMVLPSASTRITSTSSKTQDQSLPEAIAKKRGLTRSESVQSNGSIEGNQAPKPEAFAKLQYLRDKPRPVPPSGHDDRSTPTEKDSVSKDASSGTFTASLAGVLRRGPTQSSDTTSKSSVSMTVSGSEIPSQGQQLTHVTKARARGPKRRLPTASKQPAPTNSSVQQAERDHQSKASFVQSQQHNATMPSILPQKDRLNTSEPDSTPLSMKTDHRKSSPPLAPRKSSTTVTSEPKVNPASPMNLITNQQVHAQTSPPVKQKPISSPENTNARKSSVSMHNPAPITQSKQPQTHKPRLNPSEPIQEQQPDEDSPQDLGIPLSSVKAAATSWSQSITPDQTSQIRSPPIKLPTLRDEEAALEGAGLKPKKLVQTPVPSPKPSIEHGRPPAILQSTSSPSVPGKKPSSIPSRAVSTALSPTATHSKLALISQPLDATSLFANIFDVPPTTKYNLSIDTQAVVDSRSSNHTLPKIKTLRKQIFELTANGVQLPVPPHQEHILFNESIYVCTHVFGNSAGQRATEVYLWCGDATSSSSTGEAQIFAKKHAKDNNARLIILKEGKETATFFQALGGIVIIRRGSSVKAEASLGPGATYMLCGRQHLGQIAFDEVNYSSRSLCKGFPFIISANDGKLYLWKGSGSGADELGCARLIGMDLGLTGEIEEVDDGQEPDSFWELFPERQVQMSHDTGASQQHWQLKPSCENYSTRLFNVTLEVQRPKSASGFIQGAMQWGRRGSAPTHDPDATKTAQIKEIIPFAQSDLVDDGILVLDTFFEVFVYV